MLGMRVSSPESTGGACPQNPIVSRAGPLRPGGCSISNRARQRWAQRPADVAQEVEQLTCNQQVVGSTPTIGSFRRRRGEAERYPSGQREQTVNLPANAFGGSNPPLSTSDDAVRE